MAAIAAVLSAVALGGLVSACGGSSQSTTSGVVGGSEVAAVTAAPVSTPQNNPFTASVGNDTSGVTPPAGAAATTGGPTSYSGDLPGLYGGTRNSRSCDAEKLIAFLEQNRGKAAAWAATLGIQPTQIRAYVSELTPVILRTDTRVTNHGYVNGMANPIQTVLQAGTAVFLDKYGQPVVKCYCGNPLTPPVLYATPKYVGPLWAGFSPSHVTIIKKSVTIITKYVLWDPSTNKLFPRSPGLSGTDGPYQGTERTPTPAPSPRQPSPAPSPAPTPAPTPGPHTTTTPPPETSTELTPAPETPPETSTTSEAPAESPSISASPEHVSQGADLTITVSGFAAGASIRITVNMPGGGASQVTIDTDSGGGGSYTLGASGPTGTYTLTATNPATGAQAFGSFTVLAP